MPRWRRAVLPALGLWFLLTPPNPALAQAGPRATCLEAARSAEVRHGLPEGLLVALALSESGLHAYALNVDGRAHFPADLGTARRLLAGGRSVMAGCLQVNVNAHARGQDWPLDPWRAADWAADHLRGFHDRTGDWARALRRWHGGTPASSQRVVCRVRGKLAAAAPGSRLFEGQGCGAGEVARVGRDGLALLELAEAPDR